MCIGRAARKTAGKLVLDDLQIRRILPKEQNAPRGAERKKVNKLFMLDKYGLLRTLWS